MLSHAYGMSETTAVISKEPAGGETRFLHLDPEALDAGQAVLSQRDGARQIALCGVPTPPTQVVAVDPDTHVVQGEGGVGELWVGGPTLGDGYEGLPEATREAFHATTADGRGPWFRTGDLGFVWEGQVAVTGRLKDLLIVRGENRYPQESGVDGHRGPPGRAARRGPQPSASTRRPARRPWWWWRWAAPSLSPSSTRWSPRCAPTPSGPSPCSPCRPAPSSRPRRARSGAGRCARPGRRVTSRCWRRGTPPTQPRSRPPRSTRQRRSPSACACGPARCSASPLRPSPDDVPVRELGLDSIQAVELAEGLSADLGRAVPVTDLFDHPTVAALAAHLAGSPGDDLDDLDADALAKLLADELG